MNRFVLCCLLSVVCAAALPAVARSQPPAPRPAKAPRGGDQEVACVPADTLGQLSASLEQLASRVSPAVVQIEVTFFGPAEDENRNAAALLVRQRAIGAGVIVGSDGYIVTNAHVVEGAQRIRVLLSLPVTAAADESVAARFRALDATLVGSEKMSDLALLKIDATDLPTLSFRLDRAPQPGELVFAIGSPSGLRNSVTMGVISANWRQPDPDSPMVYLQTDAPISPGNSGGPLVDVKGAIVGLNTFIVSSGGGNEGLGFAIPARIVDFVYQSLRMYGHVDHIDIGARAQAVTPTLAKGLGLAQDWGIVIADVSPRGPAARAGLQPGDIVLAVDGDPMLNLTRFAAALYQHPTHEILVIEALRGTQKVTFRVPAFLARGRVDRLAGVPDRSTSHIVPLGVLALNVDAELRALVPDVRASAGVLILGRAPGFDLADNGLRSGDVILALNRAPIETVEQLNATMARLKRGDAVVLQVERAGRLQYLAFELD